MLLGAKAPILDGAQMGTVIVPFIKCEPPYTEIKDLIEKLFEFWMEEGKNRERVGETMKRLGLAKILEIMELDPDPRMIQEPRTNPYIFWKEEEVTGGWDRKIEDYRSRHKM